MKKIDSRIQKGTFVLLGDGTGEGWYKVKELADHRKWLKVEGLEGSFQNGHLVKFTNNRLKTIDKADRKLKRIVENLTGVGGLWPVFDSVFGACHAYNTSFTRLDGEDGCVVLVEESIEDWDITKYHIFDSYEEYRDWFNNQLNNYGKGRQMHYGDCSLAYRAAKSLGFIRDEDIDYIS